jgi:hypothetical protein
MRSGRLTVLLVVAGLVAPASVLTAQDDMETKPAVERRAPDRDRDERREHRRDHERRERRERRDRPDRPDRPRSERPDRPERPESARNGPSVRSAAGSHSLGAGLLAAASPQCPVLDSAGREPCSAFSPSRYLPLPRPRAHRCVRRRTTRIGR